MIRIQLPPTEADRLDALFRSTADLKFRVRLQIVLMAHRGRPHGRIACDTATSRRSVQRWLNASLERCLDALRPRKPGTSRPEPTPSSASTRTRLPRKASAALSSSKMPATPER